MILDDLRKYLLPHLWKEDEPVAHDPIKYHHEFGFETTRELKKPQCTEQEMDSCNLDVFARDSCAHLHIAYRTCMRANGLFWWRCNGFKNELSHCYFEQKVDDMKEFEREKRLNARERRLRSS